MVTIQTNNRNIYEKLNMLKHFPEVILYQKDDQYLKKILSSINKNGIIVEAKKVDDYIVLKKVNKLDLNVFLR